MKEAIAQHTQGLAGPQGDGEEYNETALRILEAAAQVFSTYGYAGATTRAIAEAADVNEVTLFRHFGTKRKLFEEVIARFSAVPGLTAMGGKLTGDYRQDLTTIGRHYLAMLHRNRRAILMTMAEVQRQPEIRSLLAHPPTHQREMLAGYLRKQMARGVVRELADPELAAQGFFGMFFEYSMVQLLDDPGAPQREDEEVVAQFVDLFVRGTVRD
jgi:AcrR family transcriptional regulator